MTANRTSLAVEWYLRRCEQEADGADVPPAFVKAEDMSRFIVAMAKRHRRMEEALEEIVHDRNAWPECAKGYERKDMMDIAEEALAFDPLKS